MCSDVLARDGIEDPFNLTNARPCRPGMYQPIYEIACKQLCTSWC